MAGSGTEGGEIQVGVLVKEITQKLYGGGGKREDRSVPQEEDRYRFEC